MTGNLSKRFLKIVSFVFSVGLWLHLVSSQETSIYKDFKIEYDIADNMSIASDHVQEVKVKLKGPKAIIRNFENKKIKMKIKMNQLEKTGVNSFKYIVDLSNVEIPFGVNIEDYSPKEEYIVLEKKGQKKIPLELTSIKGAEDLTFLHQSIMPKEILISGAKSILANINKIQINPFEIDPSNKNGKINITLNWPDPRVSWQKENIYFSYISEIKDDKKSLKNVPVTFITNKKNFDATANKIEIIYVSKDELPLSKITVSADLTSINDKEHHEIDLKVNLPDEYQMIKIIPKTIKARLK